MPPEATATASDIAEPPHDCPLCPRLVGYRRLNQATEPGWFNGPVPSWGDAGAPLLIVGMAPGVRGANRTGRPFTGDHAGILLYQTLTKFGFATGRYDARPDDGLNLRGCRVVNAVRCVPPANLPQPDEIKTCNQFLQGELSGMSRLRTVLVLGLLAHAAVIRALGLKQKAAMFRHGAQHALPNGVLLADSYHVSRYNTNTGRLTTPMFEAVVAALVDHHAAVAARLPPHTTAGCSSTAGMAVSSTALTGLAMASSVMDR